MAPNVKVAMAFRAMKDIGISEETVRPVLKNLLKLYDKNWELIEEENYRVLADAIFDYEDSKAEEAKKEAQLHEESGPPLKRLRSRQQEDQASPSVGNTSPLVGETSFRRPKLEENYIPQTSPIGERVESSQMYLRDKRTEPESVSPQMHLRDKRKEPASPRTCPGQERAQPPQLYLRDRSAEPEPVSPQKGPVSSPQTFPRQERGELSHLCIRDNIIESQSVSPPPHLKLKGKEPFSHVASREKRTVSERASSGVCFKEPKVEPGIVLLPKEKLPNRHHHNALVKPKSEPFTDDFPQFEIPIAVIHPLGPPLTRNEDPVCKDGNSIGNDSSGKADGLESMASQHVDRDDEGDGVTDTEGRNGTSLELANIPETTPANFEIASSPLGEVKISLSCNSALGRPDFHMPSLDAVLKMVEDKCLKSYKIIEPNFSLMKLMKELCQCFLELGTDSIDDKQENFINIIPTLDLLKKSKMQNILGAKGDQQSNFHMPANFLNGSPNFHSSPEGGIPRLLALNGLHRIIQPDQKVIGRTNDERDKKKDLKASQSSNSRSLVVVQQHQFTLNGVRPLHDVNDITKGEEGVKISLVNEVTSESYPPSFYYIPQNIVYQNAYVNFSLARIGDEDCCASCFGDCMSSSIPCACARETGGEFAYTLEGLIKKEFLDECISMSRDPQQHRLFYCKDCPLERSKNEDLPDPCKGHLVRKFIKECWSKCGCNKQCGNRVVQRGITCNLQVFLTPEGKGWGLRTLEDLPRGSFVCEYVGEILTNMELYERNNRSTGNEKHTYPVLLDADWGSEGVLKDEEALCLDATFYGNVARFINHRCCDATLVEIPVEVETPDHHYYHLAFFTTRKVDALEELTWDYGIDFDDHAHPVKAFRCRCGSKCCRDMKRSNRTKLSTIVTRSTVFSR